MHLSVVHPRRRKAVAAGVVAVVAAITTGFIVLAPAADAAEAPSTRAIYNDPTAPP